MYVLLVLMESKYLFPRSGMSKQAVEPDDAKDAKVKLILFSALENGLIREYLRSIKLKRLVTRIRKADVPMKVFGESEINRYLMCGR